MAQLHKGNHVLEGVVHQYHGIAFPDEFLYSKLQLDTGIDRHDYNPIQVVLMIEIGENRTLLILKL
jgi:hypothetical protein